MTHANLLRVVLWMSGALLSFSAMAVSVRALAGALSLFEILAIRSGGGLLILLAILAARPTLRHDLAPRRMTLHAVRNGTHFLAQYAWAASLTMLPFATVFALEFTMPAWAALLAILFLHEKVTPSRIGSIVLGLIGVLVILRPGLENFQPATLLVLAAAFGYAINVIATKMLTSDVTPFAIVFWMNAMQLPVALAGSDPLFLLRIEGMQVIAAIALAVVGLSAHYCLSNAFRAGDAIIVVPLDFLRIPLIAFVGWAFYGEALDGFVFLGAAIIISGVVWNLYAESWRK